MQPFKTKNQSNLWNTQRHMAPWTFQEFEIEISEVFFQGLGSQNFPLNFFHQVFEIPISNFPLKDLRLRSHFFLIPGFEIEISLFQGCEIEIPSVHQGFEMKISCFLPGFEIEVSMCCVFSHQIYFRNRFWKWRRNLIRNYAWKLPMSNHNSFSQRTFKKRPDTIWNTSS